MLEELPARVAGTGIERRRPLPRLRRAPARPGRRRRVPPVQGRHGRGQRRRRQARAARVRRHAARPRRDVLRGGRHVPQPRAQPAARREQPRDPRSASWPRRPTSASPGTATPTAASSSTRTASSCPATSSPRCSPRRCCSSNPGAKILYDLRASRAVPDMIRPTAACPCSTASGTPSSSSACAARAVLFGGEVSGHYYFADNYNADSGFIPALLILELLSRRRRRWRSCSSRCARPTSSAARSTRGVDDVPAALARIEQRFADGEHRPPRRHLGRLRPTGTSTCAPSNTEPLLRLNLGADSRGAHGGEARPRAVGHPRGLTL